MGSRKNSSQVEFQVGSEYNYSHAALYEEGNIHNVLENDVDSNGVLENNGDGDGDCQYDDLDKYSDKSKVDLKLFTMKVERNSRYYSCFYNKIIYSWRII